MLSLEELFKKRNFIYFVDGDYYAFGGDVCARCDSHATFDALTQRYNAYISLVKDKNADDDSAWDVYKRLAGMANNMARDKGINLSQLEEKFIALQFSDEDKAEIEHQLEQFISFFCMHHLADYLRVYDSARGQIVM